VEYFENINHVHSWCMKDTFEIFYCNFFIFTILKTTIFFEWFILLPCASVIAHESIWTFCIYYLR